MNEFSAMKPKRRTTRGQLAYIPLQL